MTERKIHFKKGMKMVENDNINVAIDSDDKTKVESVSKSEIQSTKDDELVDRIMQKILKIK